MMGAMDGFVPAPGPLAAPEKRSKLPLFAGCGGLLLLTCCGCLGFAAWRGQLDRAELGPLAAACDGRPVEDAAAHPATSPRLIVFERDDGGWSREPLLLHSDDQAGTRAEASLVICLEEEQRVEDTECSFMTITEVRRYPRSHYAARARLVEARTGRVIAAGEVVSPTPPCTSGAFVPDDDDAYEGETIGQEDVRRWYTAALAGPAAR